MPWEQVIDPELTQVLSLLVPQDNTHLQAGAQLRHLSGSTLLGDLHSMCFGKWPGLKVQRPSLHPVHKSYGPFAKSWKHSSLITLSRNGAKAKEYFLILQ